MIALVQATTREHLAAARQLFTEYVAWLDVDLRFQDFQNELAELPGKYAPPDGRLYLAFDDAHVAGCIALRQLSREICEMKRLYVQPAFRGKGIGKLLAQKIIDEARAIGYARMRLDTLDKMPEAQALYRALGFREIESYYTVPEDYRRHVTFMELILD